MRPAALRPAFALLLGAGLLAAGCLFEQIPLEGLACDAGGRCASGFTCAGGLCLANPPGPVEVSGAFEKGPFVIGSRVTLSSLDAEGAPAGQVFPTATVSDRGDFVAKLPYRGLVLVSGEGYYYNEVLGRLSTAPLELRALSEVSDAPAQAAYANVLTHLSYERAKRLLPGAGLSSAVEQAEGELIGALGIGASSARPRGSETSILGEGEGSAYLFLLGVVLAQAAVLQADGPNGPVDAALQELLNRVALDLAEGGDVSPQHVALLAQAEASVDVGRVLADLAARLLAIGSDEPLPDLAAVIDRDRDGVPDALDNCPTVPNPQQEPVDCPLADQRCGDGRLDAAEECDDGDNQNGNGCSADCSVEDGWTCDTAVQPSTCTRVGCLEVGTACNVSQQCCSSFCSGGTCAEAPNCAAPLRSCGGSCVDVSTHPDHCGECDQACGGASPVCSAGACAPSEAPSLPGVLVESVLDVGEIYALAGPFPLSEDATGTVLLGALAVSARGLALLSLDGSGAVDVEVVFDVIPSVLPTAQMRVAATSAFEDPYNLIAVVVNGPCFGVFREVTRASLWLPNGHPAAANPVFPTATVDGTSPDSPCSLGSSASSAGALLVDANTDGGADLVLMGGLGTFLRIGQGADDPAAHGRFSAPSEMGFPSPRAIATFRLPDTTAVLGAAASGSEIRGRRFDLSTGGWEPLWPDGLLASPAAAAVLGVDLDGDGQEDVVWWDAGLHMRLYSGGNLVTVPSSASASPHAYLVAGDFDGDGRLDVAAVETTAAPDGQYYLVWLHSFSAADGFSTTSMPLPGLPHHALAADMNGDGRMDLVVSLPGGVVVVFRSGS